MICEMWEEKIWITPCVIPWKDPINFTPIARGKSSVAMLGKAHLLLSNQEVNNI